METVDFSHLPLSNLKHHFFFPHIKVLFLHRMTNVVLYIKMTVHLTTFNINKKSLSIKDYTLLNIELRLSQVGISV